MRIKENFHPGITVKIWLDGYWHFGIVGYGGMVIHNSKTHKRVICEAAQLFAEGRVMHACQDIYSMSPEIALLRAYGAIGGEYRLWTRNCEHFVRWVHNLEVESPQVQRAVLTTAAITLALSSGGKAGKFIGLAAAIGAIVSPKPMTGSMLALIGSMAIISMGVAA